MFISPFTDKGVDWRLAHEKKCKEDISILDAARLLTATQWANVLKAVPVITGGSFPIQVMPIAQKLGLNIYHVKDWPDELSGMLQKDKYSDAGFAIYLNDTHPDVRKRFRLAYEIAHYILYRDEYYECDDKDDNGWEDDDEEDYCYWKDTKNLTKIKEFEMIEMAADIIMPWHLINGLVKFGIHSIEDLALKFNVSPSYMLARVKKKYKVEIVEYEEIAEYAEIEHAEIVEYNKKLTPPEEIKENVFENTLTCKEKYESKDEDSDNLLRSLKEISKGNYLE